LWAKGLNAKDIHKEMFPVYGGKCLSCKAFHNYVQKFSEGRSNVADDARRGHPVQNATKTKTYAAGFDAVRQVYQCWWNICPEINIFLLGSSIKYFAFCIICDLFDGFPSSLFTNNKVNGPLD
jgi:hypothetical protein